MLLLLSLACSPESAPYTTPERLLDAPEVTWLGAGNGEATLAITGSAEEWTLVDLDATWTLASPAAPDLAPFDGAEGGVTVDAWYDDTGAVAGESVPYSAVTLRADSTIAYWLSPREPASTDPFGAEFVAYGDSLGTLEIEYWILTVRELVFATDEGDVAVGPSEPTVLVVGGDRYLTTVFAAWESDVADPNVGQPRCGGIGDRLAYEMVLLSDEGEDIPEVAPGTGEITRSSCG